MTELFVTTMSRQDIESLIIDCMKVVIKHHLPKQESLLLKESELFLTKKQAAKKLNCSTSTIDNYARAGKVMRYYLGKTVRFKLDEVLALATTDDN